VIKDTYPSKQDSFSARVVYRSLLLYLFIPLCSTDSTRIYMINVACERVTVMANATGVE
jgi:hypothetical protein